ASSVTATLYRGPSARASSSAKSASLVIDGLDGQHDLRCAPAGRRPYGCPHGVEHRVEFAGHGFAEETDLHLDALGPDGVDGGLDVLGRGITPAERVDRELRPVHR